MANDELILGAAGKAAQAFAVASPLPIAAEARKVRRFMFQFWGNVVGGNESRSLCTRAAIANRMISRTSGLNVMVRMNDRKTIGAES